ncbi:hypothetical protein DJ69_16680 [Halorubrum persicum]|uniref:Tetratricopeptide repeat protein n=2 Tax=Halorubrum persicum TaxID=1383844 RepID=A0A2G1WEU5_9EURY|nr:hypothetical protein DJ69_16680 [Halorubrum persicum]
MDPTPDPSEFKMRLGSTGPAISEHWFGMDKRVRDQFGKERGLPIWISRIVMCRAAYPFYMTASDGAPNKKGNEVQHLLTQDTRFQIVQNILAHPESLPSLRELEYVVDKGRSTIYEHLETLEKAGITDRFELEGADRDQPSTFYGLTPYGIRVVDDLDLFNDLDLLQEIYVAMDKPAEVQAYEAAPRPGKATQEELEDELAGHLEAIDETEGELDEQIQRRIEGLSFTLEQSSEIEIETSAAQELGQRLLNVLSDSAIGPQVLDGFRDIAEVAPDAIAPTIPRLIDLLDGADAECQTKALQVLVAIATSEEASFDTDVRDRLTNLDIFSLIRELPLVEARSLVEGLDELYAEIGATEARAEAMNALGQYAGRKALNPDVDADDAFGTATQAFETTVTQYEQLDKPLEQAESLHQLGLLHFLTDRDPVAEPFSEAASLYATNGEYESAARVYAQLSVMRSENDEFEAAADTIDHIESLDGSIEDESTRALISAAKALLKAHNGDVTEAISLLEESTIVNADEIDKSIFGSVQLILAYHAIEAGNYETTIDLAESAKELAEETKTKRPKASAEQIISSALLRLNRGDEAKEHLEAAVECFKEIDDTDSTVDSLRQLANIQMIDGEFGPAISTIERGLSLLDENATIEQVELQLKMADIYAVSGDTDALEVSLKSIEELLDSEDIADERIQAELNHHWGGLRMSEGNPEAAVNEYTKAVDQYTATENLSLAITTQIELAEAYSELREYTQAIDCLDTAIEFSEQTGDDTYRPTVLFRKADIHREQGNLDTALENIERILNPSGQQASRDIITGRARFERGSILSEMSQYAEARDNLTEALSTLREEGASHLVVNVLRALVRVAVESEEPEQVISWCESAESYLDSCDESFSPETRLYFVKTRAQHQGPTAGVEDLFYVGLRYLDMDQVDDALQPLREAWNSHTELDSGTDAYTAALSAGVGFVGATRLVTLDEAQAAGDEVLEELESYTESLSDSARYLYQFLAESTNTHSNLELEAAERIDGDYSQLSQLEAVVFRDLVEQLRSDDDEFESDPTEPIRSAIGSTAAATGTAVTQQAASQSATSAAGMTGRRSAD